MQTYMQSVKGKSFNWYKVLKIAKGLKKTGLDILMLPYLTNKSSSWVTCACGNMCDIIPRNNIGCPFDKELTQLGGKFHGEVSDRDYTEALNTLDQIEERSEVLIKRIMEENLEKRQS